MSERRRPFAKHVDRRHLGRRLCLHFGLEGRALGDRGADPPADRNQHDRQQERHPPAPGEEIGVALRSRPGSRARRRRGGCPPARPPAASSPRSRAASLAMLGGEQHRAAPFAADREALDEAEQDERDRRRDADLARRSAAGRSARSRAPSGSGSASAAACARSCRRNGRRRCRRAAARRSPARRCAKASKTPVSGSSSGRRAC